VTLVAALGDSITAGSPLWDPGSQSGDPTSQWEYWASLKDRDLDFRNCGVYGERTDEIAARLERCAAGSDVLIVQGGINDIAQGRSVDVAAANLLGMVQAGKARDLRVAVAELLPWNNGYPQADPEIRRLNRLIHEFAAAESVTVLPFYGTLEDGERPGRMQERWTDDGDHPSIDGYRRLGELAFRLP
jgi:lysophospholipase L1-like esterase